MKHIVRLPADWLLPLARHPLQHLPESQPAALLSSASKDGDGLVSGVKAFFPETFDQVLLDPPCSALGLRPRFAMQVRTDRHQP